MARLTIAVEKTLGPPEPGFTLDVSFQTDALTTVVFGPSGSGKTTLLRAVAGLLTPDAGLIAVGRRVFYDGNLGLVLPPYRRNLGMVFQQPSLFPHLTSLENVHYSARVSRSEAGEILERFHVGHTADRRPAQLSGGEQQRIVIARALAARPEILLLDEPLSAVDAATRAAVIRDLLSYQTEHQVPYLYVTHNRVEALGLGGEALLLDRGRLIGRGGAAEVLTSPVSPEVARVLGAANVLPGVVAGQRTEEGLTQIDVGGIFLDCPYTTLPLGSSVAVSIPSEDVILSADPVGRTSARNSLQGTVTRILDVDHGLEVVVSTPVTIRAHITRPARDSLGLCEGGRVYLLIKAMAIVVEPL